jgi:DNA-binding PadR family transcriptional regulator
MDTHKNARLTPKGREEMGARRGEWRAKLRRCRPQV